MGNKSSHSIERIGRSIYPLRVLGFFLFGLSILLSQEKLGLSIDIWSAIGIAICLVYPHVVFYRYLKNEKRETELKYMLVDMALQGVMTALVGFNLAVALPYLIANSAANYALRGVKQSIKGMTLAIVAASIVGFFRNEPVIVSADFIELIGPFSYLIIVTHYMGYLAYVRGTALIKSKKAAELLAQIDFLTGLNNRRSMYHQVNLNDAELRITGNNTTVIMIDLDHFKQVNDNYGHNHGDVVLIQVSELIKSSLRETDIVARWGGEEFLVLLPKTNIEQGIIVAETIRKNIANNSVSFIGVAHNITATLGVASYDMNSNFDTTLQQADKALYDGKQQGRNRVVIVT